MNKVWVVLVSQEHTNMGIIGAMKGSTSAVSAIAYESAPDDMMCMIWVQFFFIFDFWFAELLTKVMAHKGWFLASFVL